MSDDNDYWWGVIDRKTGATLYWNNRAALYTSRKAARESIGGQRQYRVVVFYAKPCRSTH